MPLTESVMPVAKVTGMSPAAVLEAAEKGSVHVTEPLLFVVGLLKEAVIPAGSVELTATVAEPAAILIAFRGIAVTYRDPD
jgi:hypothetical protein